MDNQVNASRRLGRYVRVVGAGALLVAGLGMLAICWISVSERANEIGLRRAVGATQAEIFAQFLLKAAALGLVGGAAGAALSVGTIAVLLDSGKLAASAGMALAGYAWAAALAINLVFASLPAWRAASLDPVDCLRPL